MPSFLEGVLRQLEDTLFNRGGQTDLNRYMNPQIAQRAEPDKPGSDGALALPWWEDEEPSSQLDEGHWYRMLVEGMTPKIPSRSDRQEVFRNTREGRRDMMSELDRGTSYEGTRYE